MCTVTFLKQDSGYELHFNRDELRSRTPGLPPRLDTIRSVQAIFPVDSAANGTWMGVNEYGCSLAILNYYAFDPPDKRPVTNSRGQLVRLGLFFSSLDDINTYIRDNSLSDYLGFQLLAVDGAGNSRVFLWDGTSLHIEDTPTFPLTSSSFDADQAQQHRCQTYATRFETHTPSSDQLTQYHQSHEPEKGPFSVCMHRTDGVTVSYNKIVVAEKSTQLMYYDGAPCEAVSPTVLRLDRR